MPAVGTKVMVTLGMQVLGYRLSCRLASTIRVLSSACRQLASGPLVIEKGLDGTGRECVAARIRRIGARTGRDLGQREETPRRRHGCQESVVERT